MKLSGNELNVEITAKTWLTILFTIATLMAVYLSFTEPTYTLRHAVLDIETVLFLITLFLYKEEVSYDEDTPPA